MLDAAAEAAVRDEWRALDEAGVPSMARHTGASNRPHITMLVRTSVPVFDAAALCAREAFPVVLGAPVLFGSHERRILARAVVPSRALLALHADLHAAAGPGDDAAHTLPGAWTPHVTLARRVRGADLARVVDLVGAEIPARAAGMRRWEAASRTVTALGAFGF